MKFSNKLSLAILITGIIVLILSSITISKLSYSSNIKAQLIYTKSIADKVSADIDQLLHEKVKTALTLANTPIIKKSLETSNFFYDNLSDEKRKESIKIFNDKWKSTKDPADEFILKFTDNSVSHFLKNQQTILKDEYGEIFLTNKFGALVASTSRLSTLAHGHKYWWTGAYNNGEGAVFFDDRGYDDSVDGYVLGIVVPIRKGPELVGILKCNLNILGSISKLISGAEDKLIGKFKLIRSGGAVVFEEGVEPLSTQVHDSIFNKLKSKNVKSFIFNDSGEKYLVGFSQIKLTKAEKGYGFGGTFESIDHKKGNKGESWYVICYRQMRVALSPITESIKSFILIGTAIIVILVLVSQLFGRKIAKPLALLDKATEKIGKGDFEYRIDMGQNDEFGNLAHSFNNMASTLQQSTTSIDLLRESEGRYRNIFENIQDVYYEASMDGTILEVSPSIENVSEYKKKEVIGKSLYDFYTDPKEREELLNAILVSEKVANFEITLTDKDGSPHPVELNTTLQRDQKGNPIKLIGSMRDISKRKQLEARLRHSRKMEAIGTLAGGIAHEFNNILTTVIGNTELAIADVPASNPARECLEEIQTASLRAKDVVSQLLGFARKTVFQLMPVRINPIVSETLKLIRASIPTTIEIRQDLSCQSDTVLADTTQIKQVLMNLCANANNAMQEEGGVLDVNLENTTLDETSAAGYEDLGPGNYLKMTVRDTGHGIDPKIIDRIFDPYFTTTSLAEGTGMGLAVVHGIVKHHNGAITVESEPGKGTVFEVLFPLVEAEAEQEAGEPEALPAGNEKILFVDDEPSLVKMAKRMLEMQGYRVEAKGNPVEALEMVRSEPDRFDLVITDMTMPKMTGDKLSKEILGIRPDMPILLCSGYSDRIDADRAAALGIRKYIEKPLDMSEFVVTIRKVLDDEAKVKIQQ